VSFEVAAASFICVGIVADIVDTISIRIGLGSVGNHRVIVIRVSIRQIGIADIAYAISTSLVDVGDLVQLGQLVLYIYFQEKPARQGK